MFKSLRPREIFIIALIGIALVAIVFVAYYVQINAGLMPVDDVVNPQL